MEPRRKIEPWLLLALVFSFSVVFLWIFSGYTEGSGQEQRHSEPGLDEVRFPDAAVREEPVVRRTTLPEEIRGIYWSAYTAGTERREELLALMKEKGWNTAVIDLKMDSGELAFLPKDNALASYARPKPVIADLDELLLRLNEQGIYRIARLPVMRDSFLAKTKPEWALKTANGALWRDSTGASWLDPAIPEVADYAVALAKEAYGRGFDELQFDYARFPSDGAIYAIRYPAYDGSSEKEEVMRRFFDKIGAAMREQGVPTSFDLFGMTFWDGDDHDIGQRLLDVYPNADFISPMVYPSHYPTGFNGYKNPALYPYEIVKQSLDSGAKLLAEQGIPEAESRARFRPWLQHFHIGAYYDQKKLDEQVRAARDAGARGWIFWNARNVY